MRDEKMVSFIRSARPPEDPGCRAVYFIFDSGRMLMDAADENMELPFPILETGNPAIKKLTAQRYIGELEGMSCFCAGMAPGKEIPGFSFQNLRFAFGKMDETLFGIAGYARQIHDWWTCHKYCGRCGVKNKPASAEHVMVCPSCGLSAYPRVAPAMIVAVVRDDRLLLARGVDFPNKKMFSVLAGFVEPGETLEECVAREVFEESGIQVKEIQYFKSQPWPFPHSLMIGFTAQYASGEIKIDPGEIAEAAWFPADGLPMVPGRVSLSGQLIQWFRDQCK